MDRKEFNNSYYAEKHNYSPLNVPYYLKIFNIVKKIYGQHNKTDEPIKVLEIGCHDGKFVTLLKRDFQFDVYGIDISESMVNEASKNIAAKVADVEKEIPFPKESFDLVICAELIEHLYDTDFFLSEVYRVMKRGGHILLCTPNLAELQRRLKLLFGRGLCEYSLVNNAGHIRYYTKGDLTQQLKDHKFKVVRIVAPNITFPILKVKNSIVRAVVMKLGDYYSGLGSHLICLSRK